MSFMDLANNRQSDRAFTAQEVSRKDLLKCVQAAQLAPSACNSQPWKFIVIDDADLVKQAGLAISENPLGINKFAETVPVLVAVVEEQAVLMPKIQGKIDSNRWAQFDLGSATEHFCLQAAELGLSTCIMGAFNEEKMKELLGVPAERRIFVMLAVGYPSGTIRTKARKELNAIHCFNQYEAQ
ncbi:MAG: nitroreductase family protein [Peptococcaceae bacterium]|nr:nitroreductase family protein [Peptococcaceae bacterium]